MESDKVATASNTASYSSRPSLEEVKATGEAIGSVGSGLHETPSRRGRHKAGCQCPIHRGATAPSATPKGPGGGADDADLPPPFLWTAKEVAFIGDFPFDLGYALGGPAHEHWLDGKREAQGAYDKIAYVLNRWQVKDPVVLILALGISAYLGAIGKCAAKSYLISRKAKVKEATTENEKNSMGSSALQS